MPVKDPFLAGVLATIPEGDRAKAEARLIELEEGGLRQGDYSRLSAEAQAAKTKFDDLYTKNVEWRESRLADLSELDRLRAAGDKPLVVADPTKPVLPEGLITKKEVEALFETTERGAVGFISEANALTMKHFKEFNEILDINDLLKDTRVQQIGLRGVYADKFKDQIKAKADAAQTLRDDALRKEGADKARADLAASSQLYPVVGNESSALDAIEAAVRSGNTKVAVKSLDEMSAEYARLGSTRAGAAT